MWESGLPVQHIPAPRIFMTAAPPTYTQEVDRLPLGSQAEGDKSAVELGVVAQAEAGRSLHSSRTGRELCRETVSRGLGCLWPLGCRQDAQDEGQRPPFPPITIYIQFCDSPPRGPKGKLAENNILLNSPGNNTLLNSSPQRI